MVGSLNRISCGDCRLLFLRVRLPAFSSHFFNFPKYSPSAQRQRPAFQHRQLIRISTDETNHTLTITDLGSGMTRSDLINSLGVGSGLSSHALHSARTIEKLIRGQNEDTSKASKNDDDDNATSSDDDSVSSTSSEESQEDPADDIAGMDINHGNCEELDKTTNVIQVPCQAKDLGSFYAALCALGVQVEIGTKVSTKYTFTFD
jgi:hypothetical protein